MLLQAKKWEQLNPSLHTAQSWGPGHESQQNYTYLSPKEEAAISFPALITQVNTTSLGPSACQVCTAEEKSPQDHGGHTLLFRKQSALTPSNPRPHWLLYNGCLVVSSFGTSQCGERRLRLPGSLWGLSTDNSCCPINTEGFLNPRFRAGRSRGGQGPQGRRDSGQLTSRSEPYLGDTPTAANTPQKSYAGIYRLPRGEKGMHE